jgi:N-carbamoyl-L-amino-acid hydrolase
VHVEQGPLLEVNGVRIGAVTGVQGISWQEVTINGQSNHAGTTPMHLRRDPAYAAAELTVFLRALATRFGGNQVCTVGKVDLHPNLTNVVPSRAVLTLDVRNTDEVILQKAEQEIADYCRELADREQVTITRRTLARFEPVTFDDRVVDIVESAARARGNSVQRMPSGAGHDAQMIARMAPTAMIFVPSHKGLSHNVAEHTDEVDLVAGGNVLLDVMLTLADTRF